MKMRKEDEKVKSQAKTDEDEKEDEKVKENQAKDR